MKEGGKKHGILAAAAASRLGIFEKMYFFSPTFNVDFELQTAMQHPKKGFCGAFFCGSCMETRITTAQTSQHL